MAWPNLRRWLDADRLLFGGLVVAVVVAFPPMASLAPWHQSFATYVHAIILQAFPYLVLGALLAGLIERFLPASFLPDLTRRLGRFGILGTIALAPAVPVCECGVLPVARSLMGKGLPLPHTIAFLLAAPILNPTVLLTTWLAFGQDLEMTVLRAAGAVVVALSVGLVATRLNPRRILRPDAAAELLKVAPAITIGRLGGLVPTSFAKRRPLTGAVRTTGTPVPQTGTTVRQAVAGLGHQVVAHFLDMAGYFLIGVFIAAGMKTFISGSTLSQVGDGVVTGPLAMMATAFVLSLCAEVDAFLAVSFTEFSRHSQLAFLVFGPMFDIKLLLMYRRVFSLGALVGLTILLTLLTLGWSLLALFLVGR